MGIRTSSWIMVGAAVLVGAIGYFAWQTLKPAGLPDGIASGNGRIEAVEIDVATKTAGRIREIMVDEGEFVSAGQVLARMDTDVLEAQLLEARAQLRRATIGIGTARELVTQRKAEKRAAEAIVAQRQAEQGAAQRQFTRTEELAGRGTTSQATLDEHRARIEGAKAASSASEAQVAAAGAAISAAEAQIVDAEAAVDATRATIQRIQADINDGTLRSPRDGRIQYRVVQPSEVLSAGGRVLNLVDLGDVYMTFFLPTAAAGRVKFDTEVRLVLDAAPQYVIPSRATFVADVAQFTPKTVETAEERQKLMFRVKARISPELLKKYIRDVKTGLPGVAYIRLDPQAEWPATLSSKLLQ